MDAIIGALVLISDPYVLLLICLASAFGLFVGAMPGLTATMATALLVPVTFFMPPIPAMAVIVTASAMAIFAGDIPGALLRIPGTPASAAYTEEAYAMTMKGQAETALGAGVVFSAIGGIFGTIVLATSAPALAEVAIRFSSFEYFWLVCLGLTCAVFIAQADLVKGMLALFIGLGVALVGVENPAGLPRFTFGYTAMLSGVELIPAMVGMFAIAEVLRVMSAASIRLPPAHTVSGSIFKGQWALARRYPLQILRGSTIGTLIGALPGAGADIASYITYATAKRFSKEPEKFGTGHPEGIVESGAANNAAVSGAWIPALVFGIPGDSITAIVIGVLYIKNIIPGPMVFVNQPQVVTGIFVLFFLANLIMIPFGWIAIKLAKRILQVPREVLMPLVLLFCIVGAFAVTNSPFAIGVMLVFGVVGFVMEEHGFPIAPVILGLILGPMLEQNFVTSMIKSDGSFLGFFQRPIAGALGAITLLVWALMAWQGVRTLRPRIVSA
jgi:putative tricarboxylic transport membrane protein